MISRTTLWRRMRELGITTGRYSDVSDSELDSIITTLVRNFPNSGITMMWGHLRSMSVHVPRRRVSESLHRVNPAAVRARQCTTVARWAYILYLPQTHCGILVVFIALYGGDLSFMVELMAFHDVLCTWRLPQTTDLRLFYSCSWKQWMNVAGHPEYVLIEGERTLVLLLLWWQLGVLEGEAT